MFLHRVGGIMTMVGGRGWNARFRGLAWCRAFVFPGSSPLSLLVCWCCQGRAAPVAGAIRVPLTL